MLLKMALPQLPRFKLFGKELPITEGNNGWWLALFTIYLSCLYYLNFKAVTGGLASVTGIEIFYVCITVIVLYWISTDFSRGTRSSGLVEIIWQTTNIAGFHWAMNYSSWSANMHDFYFVLFSMGVIMSFCLKNKMTMVNLKQYGLKIIYDKRAPSGAFFIRPFNVAFVLAKISYNIGITYHIRNYDDSIKPISGTIFARHP